MSGIPPHAEPQTPEGREIAAVMALAHSLCARIMREMPDLPPTAIGTGFVNVGVQIGCRHADAPTVAFYLHGVAAIIAPPN